MAQVYRPITELRASFHSNFGWLDRLTRPRRGPAMRTSGSEETPETDSPPRIDPTQPPARLLSLQCLLSAYQDTIDYIDGCRAVFWYRPSSSSYVPLPALASRFLTRYFFMHHLKRGIDRLRRRYEMRAALIRQPDSEASERAILEHFADSLPNLPTRRLVLALIGFAILVTVVLAEVAPPEIQSFLREAWFQLLRFDFSGFYESVTMFDKRPGISRTDLGFLARALVRMLLSFYLPITALVGSFRLYRKLSDEFPKQTQLQVPHITSADLLGADRVSMLEARLFAHLGARRPSDVQVDLVRSSLFPCLIIIFSSAYLLALALFPSEQRSFCREVWLEPGTSGSCPSLVGALLFNLALFFPFLVLPLARLQWVLWTWRLRNSVVQNEIGIADRQLPGYVLARSALRHGIVSVILPGIGIIFAALAISRAHQARKKLLHDPDPRGLFALTTGRLLGFASIAWQAMVVVSLVNPPPA